MHIFGTQEMWTAVLNCGDGRCRYFLFHACLHSLALLKNSHKETWLLFPVYKALLMQNKLKN